MRDEQTVDSIRAGSRERLHDVQLSLIGCGVMAESIIAGLLRQELIEPSRISGSHPRAFRREELQTNYGVSMVERNCDAAQVGLSEAEESYPRSDSIIILAVKPQRLAGVLTELKGALPPDQLVLSVVAGANAETITANLRHPTILLPTPHHP